MNRKNETAAYQPKTWGLLPNISSTLKQSLQQLEYAREDINNDVDADIYTKTQSTPKYQR